MNSCDWTTPKRCLVIDREMENAIPILAIACILAILIPALTLTSLVYKPMFENRHDRQDASRAFPKRAQNETDESEQLIVLVARKCV